MTDITLAGVTLPGDLYWSDEFTSGKVGQVRKVSLTGAAIFHESALLAGRPITLESTQEGQKWSATVPLSVLRQLQGLEEDISAPPYTLVLPDHNDGTRTFEVKFSRDGAKAIEARPIRFIAPAFDSDHFAITLRLIQV